jgi:hypothetical protein
MDDDQGELAQRIERLNQMKARTSDETRTLREEAHRTADAIQHQRDALEALWDQLHPRRSDPNSPTDDASETVETNR